MRHAIDRARAAGCNLMQLTTHASRAEARRFYEQLGLSATHSGMKLMLDDPAPAS
jgi:GNAT superfamily N-acetyltransferase